VAAGLANDHLGLTARVRVGCVDEVGPRVQFPVDDPDRVVVTAVPHDAEHHGAERVRPDLDSGPAQRAVLHVSLWWWTGRLRFRRVQFEADD